MRAVCRSVFVLIVFVMMVSLRPAGVCAEAIEGTPGTAGGFTEAVRGKLELSEEKTAELLAKVYAEELSRNGEETDAESAAEQLAGESEGISRNETEASAEPSAKQPSGEETDAESAAEQPSGEETDAESVAVSQAGEAASGMCGDGLSWAYDGKGTLTVSGEGEMWEFSETETPWKDFRANVEKVVVKSGAASIGDSAFMDCRNLVRATLPKSLQSIGSAAFMNCSKLASVSVPKGVEIVGGFAFAGCDALETIAVPSTVTGLGVYAFANSRSLTTVRFGKGVTQILTGTFFGCEKLTSVGLPSALESIGEAAFSKCESLLAVALPETLLEIGERAFAECGSLVKVVIPEKTASIGDFAFSECTGLSEVTVSGEETAIGTLAFDGTPWQRGLGAFAVLNGTLMKYQGTAKNASIPQGVTRVGGCAFKDCKKLVSVAVRKGVTAIGEEAFANCGKLTEAAIARTVTQIAANAFANCDKVVIRGYANTEAEAFAAKQGLPFESAGILPISITEASLSAPEQVYTGEPLVPKVTATLDGKRLTEGTDYTVAYSYNIHAGNGIFVATGIGRYDGKKTGTFIIRKAAQSLSVAQPQSMLAGKTQKLKVSEAKTAVYFASSNTKIAKVSEDGVVTGTGYGTAKITVTAKGSDYKTVKKTVSVKVTCPAPKISKIGNVKSGLRILWNASAGAAAYRVFCKDKNGEWQKVGDTTDTAFTAKTDGSTALKVGKKYTFAVRCIKKKGSSVYTSAMREVGKSYVYVPATELEKPVSVKANTAALSWTKTAGVTGYQVQYSKDQTFTKGVRSGKVGNAGKTSAEVDSLGRGKTYYFRIRTYITVRGKNYSSAWSKVKSVVVSG